MKLTLLLLALVVSASAAEVGSPEWIVQTFFGSRKFPDKATYFTGEMRQHLTKPTIGESAPDSMAIEYRLLEQNDSTAMFAVNCSLVSDTIDFYCFIRQQNSQWKIEAVRSLALPGFFFLLLQECDQTQSRTQQQELQCRNARLVCKSDAALKKYLRDNLAQFEEILSAFESHPSLTNVRGMVDYPEGTNSPYRLEKEVSVLVDGLSLNAVSRSENNNLMINFNIGGITDNSVGYLYIPDNLSPPVMSPVGYIYIEQILPHWYIYKTT